MKKLISLVLVAAMLCCVLVGCSNKDVEALIGTWEAEVDMTELMAEEMGAEVMEFVTLENVVFTMVLKFNSDGTYYMTLDEDSAEAALNNVLQSVKDGIVAMLEAQVAELGLEMTVEEMLALSGMDMDTLMAEMEAEIDMPSLVEEMIDEATDEGKFDAKEGKLFLSAGLDYLPDPECYEVYTLEGDVLTLIENVGDETEITDVYPMVFKKVA